MTEAQKSIQQLIQLLKVEKDEDYAQYERKMLNTSIEERRRQGVTWYPVQLMNRYIGTGERYTLELDRTTHLDQNHSFQVGAVVSVFSGHGNEAEAVSGVISFLRREKMHVALNVSDLPDWLKQGKIGVNLLFDEGSYREMNRALELVLKADKGRVADLREVMYGAKLAEFKSGFEYQSVNLNTKQNEALTNIFHARDVAIIHGPPGTGKTTTLVNAIKEVVKTERQVLVCAQSNAAVDLIVEKLDNLGLDVLRLGHPARLTPEVIENSLDVKISKHNYFKELREVRKKSEEYRKLGTKYKRQFGREEKLQRDLLMKESRLLRQDADRIESQITEDLMGRAEVVACTLVGSTHPLVRDRVFKSVFIDEASQALEPACWIPILKSYRVIMAGDHLQLPPTVKSLQAGRDGLEETLFKKAIERTKSDVMLETQYRMHPHIMKFSSDYFYEGKLEVAPEILLRDKELEGARFEFIDTAGCGFSEKVKKETLSTYNEEEAKLIIQLLSKSITEGQRVGIIAPYKAQIELLRDLLHAEELLDPFKEDISVNTVDAFQGQERDVIFISLVRSNDKNEIGFLKEYRRMNVAMTRAKSKLVVVGDSATLGKDAFYNAVLDYVQSIGGYRSAFEFLYD
ncbi:AAA domain-containing protein [Roseivirga ehrenbergii]|uniref:AAA domain-containing protein n=1 Tax=Roseivirga ehrenbergii (strain DSM 102268 / JCM 13514 / KCTC 12282 / NCIMB 14502 / KMM 6017) TaxID=279360 RepID=UPI0010DAB93B|nr:AAA domain-containing protein [Roseivirga ehrenbergii]TCL01636.1 AAA domain-containing protein [Roseivirga ehrenbergii]